MPGWVTLDTQDEAQCSLTVERSSPRTYLRIESLTEETSSFCGTPFLKVKEAPFCLLAVCGKSEGAKLVAGWRWYDQNERELFSHNLFDQVLVSDWLWQTTCMERPKNGVYIRAVVGITEAKGAALFDTVLVIPLSRPENA